MGSHPSCIVPLAGAADAGDGLVGGKAARLRSPVQAGFRVPRGFCITTRACEQFVSYRVFYCLDEAESIVFLLAIDDRKDAYR